MTDNKLDEWHIDDYNRLKAGLKIDLLRLDRELVESPSNLQEACELCSLAIGIRDDIKQQVAVTKSTVICRLRQLSAQDGKMWSEERLKTEFPRQPEVVDAEYELIRADTFVGKWRSLVEGWREKSESLTSVRSLTVSGYLAPHTYGDAVREELSRGRERRQGDARTNTEHEEVKEQ